MYARPLKTARTSQSALPQMSAAEHERDGKDLNDSAAHRHGEAKRIPVITFKAKLS